ncbi:hypothetical protein GcM3_213025 [Golovinomyces cichoracearum]|uniref:rRNA methyltransferase 1, mitochondrial n=1 Tax=Golovinomyces cichoracearum TaxID=62708 RepID=A0A420H9F0_9PEZI|nr:hypothetical protein GcM3_213025 [Golovinomyces cichoracearum]
MAPLQVSKLSFMSANRYYHIGTASSVHKAIRRGLVKSRGLAFRGKTNPDPDDPREKYKRKHTLPEFNQSPRGYIKRNHDDGNSNPRWDKEGERPTHGRNDSRYLQRGRGAIRPTNIGEAPNIWGHKSSLTKSLRETMKNEMDQEKSPEDSDDMSYSALKPYESSRTPYESSRKPYESSRTSYESSRKPYEPSRTPYESSRTSYESSRKPYEPSRTPYESSRKPYESSRTPHESSRKSYESSRTPYESSRKPYESSRTPYEFSRKSYESSRTPYESSRTPDESDQTPHISRPTSSFPTQKRKYDPLYLRDGPAEESLEESLQKNTSMNRKARRALIFGKKPEKKRALRKAREQDPDDHASSDYSRKLVLTEAPLELKKEFGSSGENEVPKSFNRSSSISEDKKILEFMEDSQREYKKPSFSDSSENTGRGFVSASILNKLPISIPYTTSASEFLYGASVVEAILKPSTEIQRKLYKLYVYKGMYREDIGRDQRLQRLAEDRGVKVERVGNDWIRTLDKMSSGRPHNGYILEASPLPKLPVKGLGDVKISEDANGNKQAGFEVQLDHQTREDEAINGTSNIVKIQKSLHDKQPIVLLLDQILDPGNLGGIIRTASFLGISAIAIATRNCASMTPIVSKASAGASESMKILSVESPNEFVLNSKKNGWYIYAAVAPSQINNSIGTREILPLEKLVAEDSLPNLPSIIMMGGEGEGLRRALRNKANVQVSILGHQEPGIESLNVTVATGIICYSLCQKLYQNVSPKSNKGNTQFKETQEHNDNLKIHGGSQQKKINDTEEQDPSSLF